MKPIFAALLLLSVPAPGAGRLLILEDQVATGLAQPEYVEWRTQIAAEGWVIQTVPIPRWERSYSAWATHQWPTLNRMSNAVVRTQPDCVLIFGSLPYLQTGGHNVDGHETRRVHTDAWLGCTNLSFTDDSFWGLTWSAAPTGTNEPADGWPDEMQGNFHIPVSRIDASGLEAIGGAGSTFASGYLAGTQTYQATDEGTALRNYLRCNIDYRRKLFAFAELGRIDSGWQNPTAITSTNLAVTWTTGVAPSTFAGLTNRWAYSGFEWNLASPNFVTGDGAFSLFFWFSVWKSYHMEEWGGQHLRRPLFPGWANRPIALISTWGYGQFGNNAYWVGRSSDTTAADIVRSSVLQSSGGGTLIARFDRHWINGDLTLPCDPVTASPVGLTSATTLRILTQ